MALLARLILLITKFDLDVDAEDFRLINTTKQDSKLFYGDVNIDANLHVAGTEVKPVVDGAISVNKGTDFTIVIPQAEPGVDTKRRSSRVC